MKRGKTPVLSPEEARRVLDAIDVSQPWHALQFTRANSVSGLLVTRS
ncbi:MAG: hypothetical protein ACLPKB_24510 [Xanthobacteraceae bacterium]